MYRYQLALTFSLTVPERISRRPLKRVAALAFPSRNSGKPLRRCASLVRSKSRRGSRSTSRRVIKRQSNLSARCCPFLKRDTRANREKEDAGAGQKETRGAAGLGGRTASVRYHSRASDRLYAWKMGLVFIGIASRAPAGGSP